MASFNIDESGDLSVTAENQSSVTEVIGDARATLINESRVMLFENFLYNDYLNKSIVGERNSSIIEENLRTLIQNKINNKATSENMVNFIKYKTVRVSNAYLVFFYYDDGYEQKPLIKIDINF